MRIDETARIGVPLVSPDCASCHAQAAIVNSESQLERKETHSPAAIQAALVQHIAHLQAMCPEQPVIDTATAAGLPIAETVWGKTGPDILLIHGGVQGGLGGGPATFDKQEALAADGWRIVRIFRPGFGSSPSRGPDDMERDAVWIADRLSPGSSLIGHSWGGAEALLAAGRRAKSLRALILIEPALEMLARSHPSFMDDPTVRSASMKRLSAFMASTTPAEYGQAFRDTVGAPDGKMSKVDIIPADLDAAANKVGCSFLRAKQASLTAVNEAIVSIVAAQLPVLVISGGWSRSMDLVSEIAASHLRGRHVIVPSANHYVQEQNAAAFNSTVDTFLRSAASTR